MKIKFLQILYVMAAIVASAILWSCEDDFKPDMGGIVEGVPTTVSVTVAFDVEDAVDVMSRAGENDIKVLGYEKGDAIQNIESLWVVLYDKDGNLVHKLHVYEKGKFDFHPGIVSNVKYDLSDNRLPEESGLGDNSAGKLTFDLNITSGRYYVYGVANVDDFASLDVSSPVALKSIKRNWVLDDIKQNSEMFGIFSIGSNRQALDANPIGVRADGATMHCWLRRLASKVTIAFDGSELFDNVEVYIDTIMLCDVPKQCFLGEDNHPGRDYFDPEVMSPSDKRYDIDNGLHPVGGMVEIQKLSDADLDYLVAPNYYHVCNGSHIYGFDNNFQTDKDGHPVINPATDPQINKDKHSFKAPALYFYENLQGIGKDKKQSQDGLSITHPRPEENNLTSGWKDNKAYGTYVEVRGYYRCNTIGSTISSGWIRYRFMLGQNASTDYDARRNTHYKLTLKLRGYANQYDWHIDYKEKNGIFFTSPQYISYLYNKQMYATVKVVGEMDEATGLVAEIVGEPLPGNVKDNSYWRPWGNGTKEFPNPDDAMLPGTNYPIYFKGDNLNKAADGPQTSFLSLYQGNRMRIDVPGYQGTASNETPTSTALAYLEEDYTNTHVGERTYSTIEGGQPSVDADLHGKYTVQVTKSDPVTGIPLERIFRIPLYTREKELITRTGFTGNNPYTSYPRRAKVRFTAKIKNEVGELVDQSCELEIIQVRRVVNPKAIWRSGKTAPEDFNVTLLRMPYDGSPDFVEFESSGKWSAEVISQSDPIISLTSTTKGSGPGPDQVNSRRIEGEDECPIDFKVNFNGAKGFAIIRVRYHNYTCEHDIFCRVGYDQVELVPGSGVYWMPSNVYRFDAQGNAIYADSPLQEGSLFRRASLDAIVPTGNPVNSYKATASDNDQLPVKKKGSNTEERVNWSSLAVNIEPIKLPSEDTLVHVWTINNPTEHIAEMKEYKQLTANSNDADPDIKKAYGVVYGDGANEVQTKVADAYGYDSQTGADSKKGMRGVIVYNKNNCRQLFLPLGMSGHGRRKGKGGWSPDPAPRGTMRYASRGERYTGCTDQPLFYDLYRRPGAIYWCKSFRSPIRQIVVNVPDPANPKKTVSKKINDVDDSSAFDINFFSMGFEGFANGAVGSNDYRNGLYSDACFIRTVTTVPPPR